MARFIQFRTRKKGLPPGSLFSPQVDVHVKPKVEIINYHTDKLDIHEVSDIRECYKHIENIDEVTWVNISGLTDIDLIREIGEIFSIDRLWLEDVLNTGHIPKLEELEKLLFIISKSAVPKPPGSSTPVVLEQVSLFLGRGFVISFQEGNFNIFTSVKDRLSSKKGVIRNQGADYLFYVLIDTIVDDTLDYVEKLGNEIEKLESQILSHPSNDMPFIITNRKNDVALLRRSIKPLRDSLALIEKSEKKEISTDIRKYFGDVHDHAVEAYEVLDGYYELLKDYMGLYQSVVSQKTNEVMRVLTVFSAIFIPLTFIAGVYGMNFQHMPELQMKYGYYYVIGVMAVTAVGLLLFLRHKRWI